EPGWAERHAAHVADAASALASRGTPLAAMFVDSAFTSDGILWPPAGYLRATDGHVHRAGGLLVADEVQAGHGRSGEALWSFQLSGIVPDLVTMGKPMGNGFPVAAVVTRSELADPFTDRTGFFSTFGGNPVACAAALAVLDVIEDEGLMANATRVGTLLREGLQELHGRHEVIGDVRGWGLLIGVRLLHTSDWHVGRSIRGRSRSGEFEAVLDEVVGVAAQEAVDAVLVASDLFDHRAPSPETDGLVFEALVRLHEAGIPVVAIPG